MKKTLYFSAFLILTFLSISVFSQVKVQGVTLPAKLMKGDKSCVLNGGGVRNKYFMNVYVAGLYVTSKSSKPDEIINADKPMAVRMQIISAMVTQDRMAASMIEGFEKATGGKTAPIKKEMEMCVKIFKSEPVKVGDIYDIFYVPGEGVTATKNGKKIDVLIPGLQFKKYLFAIWLGEDPVDDPLKDSMLGL